MYFVSNKLERHGSAERLRWVFFSTPRPRLTARLAPTGSPALRGPYPRAARAGRGRGVAVMSVQSHVYEVYDNCFFSQTCKYDDTRFSSSEGRLENGHHPRSITNSSSGNRDKGKSASSP